MVEVVNLRHAFGAVRVLDGLDLAAAPGTTVCLLGPNGAGKTTAVRIMATLLAPDAGIVRIAGFDVIRERTLLRTRIGLTGQYAAVDDVLTGAEQLALIGRLRGMSRVAARRRATELLDRFDLVAAADRRIATYSGGMRRRLDLAASLVVRPTVLFLDEPTTGLDLRSRLELWDIVRELVAEGTTVILTTQYLEEADALADRIAVLDVGRIVAEGSPHDLRARFGHDRLVLEAHSDDAHRALLQAAADRVVDADASTRRLVCSAVGSASEVRGFLDHVDPQRSLVERFHVRTTTLDDVFLAVTGHTVRATATVSTAREVAHV
jgi:ABC-2 type transport system ATP-binding protein